MNKLFKYLAIAGLVFSIAATTVGCASSKKTGCPCEGMVGYK